MDALLLARSHELVSSRPARRHPKTIDGPWSWKNDDDGKGVRIGILASNFFFFCDFTRPSPISRSTPSHRGLYGAHIMIKVLTGERELRAGSMFFFRPTRAAIEPANTSKNPNLTISLSGLRLLFLFLSFSFPFSCLLLYLVLLLF